MTLGIPHEIRGAKFRYFGETLSSPGWRPAACYSQFRKFSCFKHFNWTIYKPQSINYNFCILSLRLHVAIKLPLPPHWLQLSNPLACKNLEPFPFQLIFPFFYFVVQFFVFFFLFLGACYMGLHAPLSERPCRRIGKETCRRFVYPCRSVYTGKSVVACEQALQLSPALSPKACTQAKSLVIYWKRKFVKENLLVCIGL